MPILIDPHKSINSVYGHGYKQLKSSANMIKTEQDVCTTTTTSDVAGKQTRAS